MVGSGIFEGASLSLFGGSSSSDVDGSLPDEDSLSSVAATGRATSVAVASSRVGGGGGAGGAGVGAGGAGGAGAGASGAAASGAAAAAAATGASGSAALIVATCSFVSLAFGFESGTFSLRNSSSLPSSTAQ